MQMNHSMLENRYPSCFSPAFCIVELNAILAAEHGNNKAACLLLTGEQQLAFEGQ